MTDEERKAPLRLSLTPPVAADLLSFIEWLQTEPEYIAWRAMSPAQIVNMLLPEAIASRRGNA